MFLGIYIYLTIQSIDPLNISLTGNSQENERKKKIRIICGQKEASIEKGKLFSLFQHVLSLYILWSCI